MNIKRRLSNLLGSNRSNSTSTPPSSLPQGKLAQSLLTIEWSGHKTSLVPASVASSPRMLGAEEDTWGLMPGEGQGGYAMLGDEEESEVGRGYAQAEASSPSPSPKSGSMGRTRR